MALRILCSSCRAAYQVADNLLGKKVKCRQCAEVFVANPAPPTEPEPLPLPEPVAAVTKEPDRPSPAPPPPPKVEETAPVLSELPPGPEHEEDEEEQPKPKRRGSKKDRDDRSPRKGSKQRSGSLFTLLVIFAVPLLSLVVLGGGSVGGYFLYTYYVDFKPISEVLVVGQGPGEGNAPEFPFAERPVMDRRADLEAFFRTPEEPPTSTMEFAEPPPVAEQAPNAPLNGTGQLAPEVLQKIKDATVYLRVKSSQGQSEGSGFFGVERNAILTNAHVIGMLDRNAPPPESIRVVRNKGEKNETSFPAKVVAVDQDADLALLSVQQQGMPEPLLVKSAQHLQETQPVYVAGFPLGEIPGKSITINRYELSSLKKEKGVLDKLQVHGDMLPGNSGGPVLDGHGEVIGVCVSILRNTRINFAIPGDKVWRFLNGRLAELTLETPASADGQLKVPVTVRTVDPLSRVRQAPLDFWVGKPGPSRPPSRTAPEPQPGDSPRQTLAVELKQQTGRGELALPPLPSGQAYWVQPSLVNSSGTRVWLSAQVYRAPQAVEGRPARVALKPAAEWPMVLERLSAMQFSDITGRDHRILLALETRFTDRARDAQGGDLGVYRQFTGFKEGVAIDGEAQMTTRLQHLGPHIGFLGSNLLLDAQGTIKRDDMDLKKEAPAPARRDLLDFGTPTGRFLQAMAVPLPAEELTVGKTWKARVPLPFDPTWRTLQALPPPAWGVLDNETVEVTYTYRGLRTVKGVEQPVIHLKGRVAPPRDHNAGSVSGTLSGTAVLDPSTGQIVEEELTVNTTVEVPLIATMVVKGQGTVVARLRRE